MKYLTRAVYTVLLSLVGMLAHAGENYTVKAGDTLSQVAISYHTTTNALVVANGIKNPDLIFVGQVINIVNSDSQVINDHNGGHSVSQLNVSKEFAWKTPGADMCIGCDVDEFLESNYPSDVALALAKKVNAGTYSRLVTIKPGDRFDVMMFGHSKSRHNVVVKWKESHTELAREYIVEDEGKSYSLFYPYICGNWAKRETNLPQKAIFTKPESQTPLLLPPSCKTCPPLQPSYIFPALSQESQIDDENMRRFYDEF